MVYVLSSCRYSTENSFHVRWNARIDVERVTPFREAEYRFESHAVEPAGGTGVPRPPAAPKVSFGCIDVGGDHVRFDFVGCDGLGCRA